MELQKVDSQTRKNLKRWSLSLVGFCAILAAIFITDRAVRPQRSFLISDRGLSSTNRAVASDGSDLLNWDIEREFASKLSKLRMRTPATVGKSLTERESLQFGLLQGRYQLLTDPQRVNRIWKLEFSPGEDMSDLTIEIKNHREFLERYKSVFAVDFIKAELKEKHGPKPGSEEIYRLLDRSGRETGSAKMVLNPEGGLISVEFGRL